MSYEYLDHDADVGIRASSDTLEGAFEEGAAAMFNVMVDIAGVKPQKALEITCTAENVTALFVEWLNALLTHADLHGMFLSQFKVEKIAHSSKGYSLEGTAYGEPINQKRHTLKTEVKGATYYGLAYTQERGIHILQCVVDV